MIRFNACPTKAVQAGLMALVFKRALGKSWCKIVPNAITKQVYSYG
jgi:hypothetical protein